MNDDIMDPDRMPEDDEDGQSFAELFESYSAGMKDDIQVGDKVSGRIIAISAASVFVDTGTKADGVVEAEELTDEDGNMPYKEGDTLDLYVVAASESEIRLSRAVSGIGGLNMLQEAFASHIPVQGRVTAAVKGGFSVEVLQRRAFCPISQMDVQYVEDPAPYVGQSYEFVIKRLEERGRNIVLSRRELLEKEQAKIRQAYLQDLSVDQVVTGTVTRLMPYGAFVELAPGLEGMVHISELSWSRLDKAEDAVRSGEQIQVKVLRIEDGAKPGQKKIALSAKQVSGNPWDRVTDQFRDGEKVNGKVTRCAKFGAFVEIAPGIEGLVHISEMSYTRRVNRPEDLVEPGQPVSVMIKSIDTSARRISLSMRDAEGDPWLDAGARFKPGQAVNGTVEKKEAFGVFVTLMPGITGLLPKSTISRAANASAIEKLKAGDPIAVVVSSVDVSARKISLSTRQEADEAQWRQFAGSADTGGASLGSLGEQLQKALDKKKS